MSGHKEVLWNAGENVGQVDLNNMQRFASAVTSDWMAAAVGGFDANRSFVGALSRTKFLYTPGDACAPYPDTGTAMKIKNLGGPIVQWRSGAPSNLYDQALPAGWGNEPYALVYWAAPGEFDQVHDIGGVNARTDLVSFKLETVSNDVADQETRLQKTVVGAGFVISSVGFIKRRKVRCTVTRTNGVGAASNPVMPAVPADNVPWYSLKVPAAMNSVVPVDVDFADLRMPLGSFIVDVNLADAVLLNHRSASMTLNTGAFGGATFTANGQEIYALYRGPVMPHQARVLAIGALNGANGDHVDFRLGRFNANAFGTYNDTGPSDGVTKTPGVFSTFPNLEAPCGGGGSNSKWLEEAAQIDSATDQPVWGTGWAAGYASRAIRAGFGVGTDNRFDLVGMKMTQEPTGVFGTVLMVRLYCAGGF
jgi:hypothetical protein